MMLSFIKGLFLNSKDIGKSSYIWNSTAGILFGVQSAIVLIVITRTCGLNDAGVFSIAYAITGLMAYIGEFGVRKYQVSDVNEVNSFREYFSFRIVSCSCMALACVLFGVYGVIARGYSMYKFMVIMMIGIVKLVENFVDVFHGNFQQHGRLDVAAKADTFRMLFGMCMCMISLVITHDLLISCAVWAIAVIVGMFISTILVSGSLCDPGPGFHKDAFSRIFRECFPIFLGSFLLLYIGNAPKYAIDYALDEQSQACYQFIFMPVFVIGLLANFVFNPVLLKLSIEWDRREFKTFIRMVIRQVLVIAGLTVLAIIVAMTIGTYVLGLLYNTDLSMLKKELSILMLGGGMLAMVNLFAVVTTVIRYQKRLFAGYVLAAGTAYLFSERVVERFGLTGASVLYTSLMVILCLLFTVILAISIRQGMREAKNRPEA